MPPFEIRSDAWKGEAGEVEGGFRSERGAYEVSNRC